MSAPLSPHAFHAPERFELEEQRIFARGWQLVGVLQDLPEPDSFLVVNAGGRPWVLRRTHDGVRAFLNVCLHRHAEICRTERGTGPLRCGYHGWTYSDEGCPVGIPFKRDFPSLPPDLRLASARVETWGPAIFVCPDEGAPSLAESLGPLHARLDPSFRAMGALQGTGRLDARANWKILVENAVEGYHVPLVHPSTVHPLGFEERTTVHHAGSTLCEFSGNFPARLRASVERAFPGRPAPVDGYFHANLFPNTTLASSLGHFFVLTRTEPLGPEHSRLHWWLFRTSTPAVPAPAHEAMAKVILEGVEKFLDDTYREDLAVCESVQRGCRHARAHALLGAQEHRVLAFERACEARITGGM